MAALEPEKKVCPACAEARSLKMMVNVAMTDPDARATVSMSRLVMPTSSARFSRSFNWSLAE